jgi:hypothetical protein
MKGALQVKLALLGAILYCLSFGVSRYYHEHKLPRAERRMANVYTSPPKSVLTNYSAKNVSTESTKGLTNKDM